MIRDNLVVPENVASDANIVVPCCCVYDSVAHAVVGVVFGAYDSEIGVEVDFFWLLYDSIESVAAFLSE